MKIVLIGSVLSSYIVMKQLIDLKAPLVHIFSLTEEGSDNVSGYYPLHKEAEKNQIDYTIFKKINDKENIKLLKEISPDYIFVVGLSQLLSKELLAIPKIGCIGFHPTPLPKYRGRAAMVWQVLLGVHDTKCTMFFLDQGCDSGDIIDQEDYIIKDTDYASDVEKTLMLAVDRLSKRVINKIMNNSVVRIKQNEDEASYLLIRRPEDGLIDWQTPIKEIHTLIRAVSKPYPGAFSLYDGIHKIVIWKAEMQINKNIIGLPGQICKTDSTTFDILCTDGILHVTEYDNIDSVKLLVGHKLK